jgi:hypothetical protein
VEALRGTDDAGRVADPLDPENLRILLTEAAAAVTIEARDGGPEPAARAERSGGERWSVTVSGPGGEVLVAELPNTDAAFDALRSWVAEDGWWEQAFRWRPAT